MHLSADTVLPVLIYRVSLEEALALGVLPEDLALLDKAHLEGRETDGPTTQIKPLAALCTLASIQRSHNEHKLWLWHPQILKQVPYRKEPKIIRLQQASGWFEAYIPADSAPSPYIWYSLEQLQEMGLAQS